MKNLSIKSWLMENLDLSEKPDFKDVESLNGVVINPTTGTMSIAFKTKLGKDIKFKIKDDIFYWWIQKQKDVKDAHIIGFLKWYLNSAQSRDNLISEIVDDYNNIIGDDDMPKNANNSLIGLSSTDSDVALYQTAAKPLKNYNSWGLGFITW